MAKHSFYLSVILHLRTHLELTIFILHSKQNDTIWGLLGVTVTPSLGVARIVSKSCWYANVKVLKVNVSASQVALEHKVHT